MTSFRVVCFADRSQLAGMRTVWNSLASTMKEGAVFHSLEWFEAWYEAYCTPGCERIIVVCDAEKVRAILPGMIQDRKVRGIPFRVFSYAGNGHSPRCGIIAVQGDTDAVEAAIAGVTDRSLGLKADFSIFPAVMAGTDTHGVIWGNMGQWNIHEENSYESPTCSLVDGWDGYYATRSSSFKSDVKGSYNKTVRRWGEPVLEIMPPTTDLDGALERLRRLEAKTWQHHNGTGLFSNAQNSAFYGALLEQLIPRGDLILSFLKIGNEDVSFDISLRCGKNIYSCKIGYDPEYSKGSPGLLLDYFLVRHLAESGFTELDLLGETNDKKMRMATHCQEHSNIWIFNGGSLKGALLYNALKLYKTINGASLDKS